MISDPAALAAEIQNPETSEARLLEIAGSFPEFGPLVAEHPNASRDVLSSLLKLGDEHTRKAAARRRARDVALITSGLAPSEGAAAEAEVEAEGERETQAAPASVDHEPQAQSDEHATVKVDPIPGSHFRAAAADEGADQPGTDDDDGTDIFDETRIAARSTPLTWMLVIEDHGEVQLPHTDVVIGRKPSTRADLPGAQPVTIPDPTKTVSKTHARLVRREEHWVVVDLESTNGVYVQTPRGEVQVVPGSEIVLTAGFALGDLRLRVVPGS